MIEKLNMDVFQVLLISKDAERTAKELASVFGVGVPAPVVLEPEEIAHAKYRGNPTRTRATVFPFPNPGSVDIEIIQPDSEPSIWKEFLEHNGEGVGTIGIWVNDMEESVAFMKRKGYAVAHEAHFTGGSYTIMDTKAKLGVNIMLKKLDGGAR